jgi:hypothetical protein
LRIPILPTIEDKDKDVGTPVVETLVMAIQDATLGTIQDATTGITMDLLKQDWKFLSQSKYA